MTTGAEPDNAHKTAGAPPAGGSPEPQTPLCRRVLVLEDNAIIAMEAEELLCDLGALAVDVAKTVASALELIASETYEFALLDVNLGDGNSRPAAEALAAAGTPYAFATGYGEVPWTSPETNAMPVLTKPHDQRALERAIMDARRSMAAAAGR